MRRPPVLCVPRPGSLHVVMLILACMLAVGSHGGGTVVRAACDPPDCNDNVPCTVDECKMDDTCSHIPDDNACEDSHDCTTYECHPTNGCQLTNLDDNQCTDSEYCTVNERCTTSGCASDQRDCSDGHACTTDGCSGSSCTYQTNHGACQDGHACTTHQCQVGNGCVLTNTNDNLCEDTHPCTDYDCTASGCQLDTLDHSQCTDTDYCTVNERCTISGCDSDGRVCDDNKFCTSDSCNSVLSQCVYAPNDGYCNTDGHDCTVDTCSSSNPGASGCSRVYDHSRCNDGVSCTLDQCQSTGCVFIQRDTQCNDGFSCTTNNCVGAGAGGDTQGCTYTQQDSLCDDQLSCTLESCTLAADADARGCTVIRDASGCDDGEETTYDWCNPDHTEVPGSGCVNGDCFDADECTEDIAVADGCDFEPIVATEGPCAPPKKPVDPAVIAAIGVGSAVVLVGVSAGYYVFGSDDGRQRFAELREKRKLRKKAASRPGSKPRPSKGGGGGGGGAAAAAAAGKGRRDHKIAFKGEDDAKASGGIAASTGGMLAMMFSSGKRGAVTGPGVGTANTTEELKFQKHLLERADLQDAVIAAAVTDTTGATIAEQLVYIFEPHGVCLDLIRRLLRRAGKQAGDVSSVFASTSFPITLSAAYVRVLGERFSAELLDPILTQVALADQASSVVGDTLDSATAAAAAAANATGKKRTSSAAAAAAKAGKSRKASAADSAGKKRSKSNGPGGRKSSKTAAAGAAGAGRKGSKTTAAGAAAAAAGAAGRRGRNNDGAVGDTSAADAVDQLMDALTIAQLPGSISELLGIINTVALAQSKKKQSALRLVARFILTDHFVPMIRAPKRYGLVPSTELIGPEAQATLNQIADVLDALASATPLTGAKRTLEKLRKKHQSRLDAFLAKICKSGGHGRKAVVKAVMDRPEDMEEKSAAALTALHSSFSANELDIMLQQTAGSATLGGWEDLMGADPLQSLPSAGVAPVAPATPASSGQRRKASPTKRRPSAGRAGKVSAGRRAGAGDEPAAGKAKSGSNTSAGRRGRGGSAAAAGSSKTSAGRRVTAGATSTAAAATSGGGSKISAGRRGTATTPGAAAASGAGSKISAGRRGSGSKVSTGKRGGAASGSAGRRQRGASATTTNASELDQLGDAIAEAMAGSAGRRPSQQKLKKKKPPAADGAKRPRAASKGRKHSNAGADGSAAPETVDDVFGEAA